MSGVSGARGWRTCSLHAEDLAEFLLCLIFTRSPLRFHVWGLKPRRCFVP